MLGSITPLGERGREQRWWITVSFYMIGSALAGGAFGWLLGFAGTPLIHVASRLSSIVSGVALGVLALVGVAFDLRLFGWHLPTVHRQVSREWLTKYRAWFYGLGFGLQLGVGVVTVVSTSSVYLSFIAAFLAGSARFGLVIGFTFGALRGVSLLLGARVRDFDTYEKLEPTLERLEPGTRIAAIAAQFALGITVLAMAAVI